MKKILKYTGITLLVLLALAFLLPILFKGKIVKLVKSEINNTVLAKVDFKDVSISLFRHFPKLSIGLQNLSVIGVDEFANDTLLSAAQADVSVNIMSAISGNDMKVHGLFLQSPRIHALVNKMGKANWEITKPDTVQADGGSSSFKMSLEKYAIADGYVFYKDDEAGIQAEVFDINHEGSGDFTNDVFTLATKTKTGVASFSYAGIPYLANTQANIDADFVIDNRTNTYGFKNAAIKIAELNILANGFIRLDNDSTYTTDISFDAPSNSFKNFLSLVPAVYKNDFDKIKTGGAASFKGFVKGTYSPTQLPAYNIDLNIKDGFFQYPDLPQRVKNIQVAANFSNKDGALDNTVINIQTVHLEMGTQPFDFKLLFKNPLTTKYIDAVVKGKLNLSEIGKFVKLDAGTKISGLLDADAFAKGELAGVQNGGGLFSAGGLMELSNLNFTSPQLPQPVKNGSAKIAITNQGGVADATTINVSSAHLQIGNNPIDFNLMISKPISEILFSGAAKGTLSLGDIKQFIALEQGTVVSGILDADMNFNGSKADIDNGRYENIGLAGNVNFANVNYKSKSYPEGVQVQNAALQFNPQTVQLNNFSGSFQNTNFTANGVLQNVVGYALNKESLQGNLSVAANKINLNNWLTTDTVTNTGKSTTTAVAVPPNMNITINAKADEVHYDKVDYRNAKGTLLVKDETVTLQNVFTNALDGNITFNGAYSTKADKQKPAISLNYTVKDVDVQKAFYAFNTVQKLMPAGKFLSGKISSQFSMIGKLNGDMMPDLTSLTGNGNLLLIQGVLAKFQPLEKLAGVLNVKELTEVSLKDIKSHFEFANGKVLVKPFNLKVKEIELQVGGMHGFDQSMDYIIGMKLPRKYLGASGNALINNLTTQANSKGIPVTVSDMVDLNVKMGGSISNPTITTDLKQAAGDAAKQMKQQAAAFVQQKTDSAKQTIKDSFTVAKKQVVADAKNELVKQLTGTKDTSGKTNSLQGTKEKASATIKNTFGGLFKKKKDTARGN